MTSMKYLNLIFLVLGLGLLALVVREMDTQAVWRHVRAIGWEGMAFVLILYSVAFLSNVAGWLLTFKTVPMTWAWIGHLYLVRMAGEAFNNVTPLGFVGGEPIKALMLKHRYALSYREAGVSLILDKTIVAIGLAVFLSIGFVLLLPSDRLPRSYKLIAGIGLIALSTGILLFFLIQRFQITSLLGRWLGGSRWGARLSGLLRLVGEVDDQLLRFYTEHRARFRTVLVLALANWLLGAMEVYSIMWFLGHPVSFTDAWSIEAMAQLVRTGTSFIPVGLGTQDAAFVLVCSAITGDPVLGLALSVIRRCREIAWIGIGLYLWWLYAPRASLEEQKSLHDEGII